MVSIDDITNMSFLSGDSLIGVASVIVTVFFYVVIMAITAAALYWLFKLLAYSTDVEIWEVKGTNELAYYGDDKVRKVVKKGVTYMGFLKNRQEVFRAVKYPPSESLIRKKPFGTKVKLILENDDLRPTKIGYSKESKDLQIDPLPWHQRVEFIQRQERYEKDYEVKNDRAQRMALVIGIALMTILMFGLFVIWQSNVTTAEATKALAGAVTAATTAAVNTLPGEIG